MREETFNEDNLNNVSSYANVFNQTVTLERPENTSQFKKVFSSTMKSTPRKNTTLTILPQELTQPVERLLPRECVREFKDTFKQNTGLIERLLKEAFGE